VTKLAASSFDVQFLSVGRAVRSFRLRTWFCTLLKSACVLL